MTIGLDGALLTRNSDGALQLVTVEVFTSAVGFYDDEVTELHTLVSREAAPARGAKPASPDGDVIFSRTRVLNLSVDISTEWAAHPPSLPAISGGGPPFIHTNYRGRPGFWVGAKFAYHMGRA